MKAREAAAYGIGILGLIAGLWLWRSAPRDPAGAGEETRAATRSRRGADAQTQALRKDAEEAARAAEAWRRKAVAAQEELGRTQAVLSAMDAPPAAPGSKPGAPPILLMLRNAAALLDDPETAAGMREEVLQQYAELFDRWGLTEAERKAVAEVLARRRIETGKLQTRVFDLSYGEEDLLREQERPFAAAEGALAGLLSGERVAEIESFDRARAERSLETDLERRIAALPLDASRRSDALRALREEAEAARREGLGDFELLSDDGQRMSAAQLRRMRQIVSDPAGFLRPFEEREARQAERLRSLLTAEELAAYRKGREQEMRMLRSVVEAWSGRPLGDPSLGE